MGTWAPSSSASTHLSQLGLCARPVDERVTRRIDEDLGDDRLLNHCMVSLPEKRPNPTTQYTIENFIDGDVDPLLEF